MSLVTIDGRAVTKQLRLACDVLVVGSGPAGATVAAALAARGVDVLVLEEGPEAEPSQVEASGLRAMASLYRDMGTSIAFGIAPMPYLQGRAVGGTSVVNGAICWNFPREVWDEWVRRDPAIADALPFEALAAAEAALETRLHVAPTSAAVAGAKNLAMARGADALGLAHRPIRRNVDGCVGSGRCLQGCPHGAKLSMDRTLLPDAVRDGARIVSGAKVTRVLLDARGAYGAAGTTLGGAPFEARARHAVVLAASAVGTPALLLASGLADAVVGRHLMGHPGVSVTGRFDEPIANYRGATQGHEITGLRHEGLKPEVLGFDLGLVASRVPGSGRELATRIAELDRYAVFGAGIRAKAEGRVTRGAFGARVSYSLTDDDVRIARRSVRRLGEVLLAAGAREVYPGVPGFDPVVVDPARMAAIEIEAPLDPRAYAMSMTHLFGTARMGSSAESSVVRGDFRHHRTPGLFVVDSSVFPSSLGVNPQLPIMAVARLAADRVIERAG